MHRFVLGLEPDDPPIDHINRNRLDNRRDNLRLATPKINQQNRNPNRPTSGSRQRQSKFRGVHWEPTGKKWRAVVRGQHLGVYSDEKQAARVAADERRRTMPFSEMDKETDDTHPHLRHP